MIKTKCIAGIFSLGGSLARRIIIYIAALPYCTASVAQAESSSQRVDLTKVAEFATKDVSDGLAPQRITKSKHGGTENWAEFYGLPSSNGVGVFPRIVVRNDVGASGAASYAAPFNAAVALYWTGGQYCSGVLIAPQTVLSARHCAILPGEQVRFGTNSVSPTHTAIVSSVVFPAGGTPNSPLLNGGDVAIVTLAQNVPNSIATPMKLADATSSLLGQDVALVGYGDQGFGSSGATFWNGLRWGGSNVLDHYGQAVNQSTFIGGTSNIFSTDFDNPTGSSNTLAWLGSSATATTFEATTAGGDSGGPLMVFMHGEWVVIGVLSGGTTFNSVYGDISWWTGVAPFRTQIEAAGGVFIPEPGSTSITLLIGCVALTLGRARRRWSGSRQM